MSLVVDDDTASTPPRSSDSSRKTLLRRHEDFYHGLLGFASSMLFNLPNILSLSRILLVPLLVAVLLTKFEGKEFVGLAVFLLASLTDFLDGYIARRQKKVTRLGMLLDPAADKILTSAAFISLVELGIAPAWMVVVIIAREFAVSALRSVAASQQLVLGAIGSAKVKTVLQVVAIAVLIIYEKLGSLEKLAEWTLWVAMVASLVSGFEYFVRYGPALFGRGSIQPDSDVSS